MRTFIRYIASSSHSLHQAKDKGLKLGRMRVLKGDSMNTLSKTQKTSTISAYVVILAIYFCIPDMGYISPSLAGIAEVYGVDAGTASYLATIVSLTQVVAALLCSFLVGKFVKHKTLLCIATCGMGISGMLPAFFGEGTPWMFLLIDRAVFGLFLGFLQPIIFAYIAQIFVDQNKRASAYGIGNIAFNVGAVFATSVGGICVAIGWNTAFWLYAVGLVAFVLVLIFYKEPEYAQQAESEQADGKKGSKITPLAWFFMAVFVVAMILDYPFFTVFVSALIEHGIADGVMGGQLMSLFTLVGIVASAVFGLLFRALKINVLPAACLLSSIGMFLLFAGLDAMASLPFVIFAVVVLGFGHTTITVAVPQCVSIACTPAVASAALAFTAVSMNVGTFISSPYMQLVTTITGSSDFTIVYLASGILMLVWSVIVFAVVKKAGRNKDEVSEK